MAKKSTTTTTSVVEEPEVELSLDDVQLFKVTFRRKPPVIGNQPRQRMYLTYGITEDNAIDRIWNTFKGTSFHREFERDTASAEMVIGKIYKMGG